MKRVIVAFLVAYLAVPSALAGPRVVQADVIEGVSVNRNPVPNPSARINTNGWTLTDADADSTLTRSTDTDEKIDGIASFEMLLTDTADYVENTSTITVSDEMNGKNCLASITFRGDASKIDFKLMSGSDVLTSVTLNNSGTSWGLGELTYPCASGYKLRLQANAANTATINWGKASWENVSGTKFSNVDRVTPWTAYTPIFTGFGTVSNVGCFHRRYGESIELSCKFTSGTSTATEARVSLPDSIISATTALIPSIQIAGVLAFDAASTPRAYVLREASVAYVTFGLEGITNAGLTKVNGSSLIASGTAASFFASLPVTGWTAELALTADTTAMSWGGYHVGPSCAFSRTDSGIGEPAADGDCNLVERFNKNMGTVTSHLDGSNERPGLVFTPKIAGKYRVRAKGLATMSVVGEAGTIELTKDTSTQVDETNIMQTGASGDGIPYTLDGTYDLTTTSTTFKLRTKTGSGTISLAGLSTSTSNIEWRIEYVEQSIPRSVVLLPDLVAAKYVVSNSTGNRSFADDTPEIVDYDSKVYDTHNAVTIGASWKFTAPRARYYKISANNFWSSVANIGDGSLILWKNTAANTTLYKMAGSDAQRTYLGSTTVWLEVGDYIYIKAAQNSSDGAHDNENDAYIDIAEVR